jgi:putative DNA primase/helicase
VLDSADAIVTQVAKQVARRLYLAAIDAPEHERERLWKHARTCEKSSAISNMIRLARAIPGIIVTHEELDARPWLLNVANGTVDLRTGELRAHDPADLLTKQAPVEYDPDATAPLWDACLHTWQPDPDVLGFLHRAVGSGATGHPVEVLIVNTGHGGNGKSKFYGAISKVLGPYVVVPHKSLLTEQQHEPHPTVIASLHGARMLIAAETKKDDRLNEASVKNLTGSDQLRARRMQEDEWSFDPTHTAFMHTNNDPRIEGTDDGIWRRVKIVRWSVKIPEADVDEHLLTKLAAEASGILNWIVAGAIQWSQHALAEPEAVKAATAAYRASEDHLGGFLTECCEVDRRYEITTGHLRHAYEKWCTMNGETAWTPKSLGRALSGRGFVSARGGGTKGRLWRGLRLADPNAPENDPRTASDPSSKSPAQQPVTGTPNDPVTDSDGPDESPAQSTCVTHSDAFSAHLPYEGENLDLREDASPCVTHEHMYPSENGADEPSTDPLDEPF